MTSREMAQLKVDNFNRDMPVGVNVTYLKSQVEGRQATTVAKQAYIQGDDTPMVVLHGIGTALIDKIEPVSVKTATHTWSATLRKYFIFWCIVLLVSAGSMTLLYCHVIIPNISFAGR